jgi:hypothetical protein
VPTPIRRKPVVKKPLWRQSMSLLSLQMMVMSGVVRRADLNPPPAAGRKGFQLPDNPHGTFPRESASEQGWLSRILLGRKPHASITNRT